MKCKEFYSDQQRDTPFRESENALLSAAIKLGN